MKILVDADACPVIKIVEKSALKHGIKVILLSDTNHLLRSDYSEIRVIEEGHDSVDMALINICSKNDIVVTQDYGVAVLALGKKAYPIHQSGLWYTNDNIDQMLLERHMAGKARRAAKKKHVKSTHKRLEEDDDRFEQSFEKLINYATEQETACKSSWN